MPAPVPCPMSDVEIRMLNYLHIVSMCVAAGMVCWGLVFFWQEDVRPWQCKNLLWVIFLPSSYLVQLNNVKAYRLSTFLRAGDRRPKPFSHMKVLRLTLALLCVTGIVLLVCALADPMTRVRVIVDKYRPKYDRYECAAGHLTKGLMYTLVVAYILISIICVIEVRNGFEAFRDGMILKEAFVVLYACLLIAFIIQSLQLQPLTLYLVRSACICIGVTLFCLRILISRCLKHWIPVVVMKYLERFHKVAIESFIVNVSLGAGAASGRSVSAVVHSSHASSSAFSPDESPLYAVEAPQEDSLADMFHVFADPERSKLFEKVASDSLCMENVNFLKSVTAFKQQSEALLAKHSSNASNDMVVLADGIIHRHISSAADEEVNICSKTRSLLTQRRSEWQRDIPFISIGKAREILETDSHKRLELFDSSCKEISVMLYQNLWNKFRAFETTVQLSTPVGKKDTIYRVEQKLV